MSIKWLGQYKQCNQWHDMHFDELNINPAPGGLIKGRGSDSVGSFTIEGGFSPN